MRTSAELLPGKGGELLITEFAGKAARAVFPAFRYVDSIGKIFLSENKDG